MVQEVLADLLRASGRRITIDEIQKRVAEHYNIRLADMHSARRARAVARPRQVAMYLAKQLTPRSLPEIGRKFGGRDRRRPQMRQDMAGAGHGPERSDWHGVLGKVRRAGAGTGPGLPG